jgi:8-oxo-dGTP pyrophosphatase MutT (NUDIX family)
MLKRREVSAGGVVYRHGEGGVEMVLGSRRTRAGSLAWGLPKGQIDAGETPEATSVREVREETGVIAEIEDSLGAISYRYVWDEVLVDKKVHFFLMRATGGDVAEHDDELEDVEWFPIERAAKEASYPGERKVIRLAIEALGS